MQPVVLLLAALGLVAVTALPAPAAPAVNKFRLKPGAAGKVCLDCHPDFAAKLTSKFVHTPVKSGDCAGCHSAHTSAHGKLLSSSTKSICLTCHDGVIPAKAVSTHKVVLEGNCTTCHDPHASPNKANLRKAGNDLCVGCHKAVGDAVEKVKFKHMPVSDGCLSCHNPHASEAAPHLLTAAVPALCLTCHDAEGKSFKRQHVDYPVAKANCASCHNPHGSNVAGILFDTVHAPVASRRCSQCHNPATAGEPFATRRAGFELCRGCHNTMMNETFAKARVHWPLVDRTGCLSCHEAHASRQKKLLNVPEAALCGECHRATADWQTTLAAREKQEKASASRARAEKGALTHAPIQEGSCTTCHMPHASDNTYLMRQASFIEGCGTCHDWLKHSSHPMGEKVTDLRNKNRSVDCLSCHRAHGTGNRFMITFATQTELCVQCHKQLRR
jgi:predicted CXXCH cytochrome family protein